MGKILTILLTARQDGMRLDKALADAVAEAGAEGEAGSLGLSRAALQRFLAEGCVLRGGFAVHDASSKAHAGESYAIALPDVVPATPEAEKTPLTVVYEDEDLLVIDKQAGMVVHPGAGNSSGTLVNALLAHCGASLSGIGGVARPGIVHRLDKDTSGLLVVAKNDFTHQGLSAQFEDRKISRTYQAFVWGLPSPLEGQVEGNIGRHPRARQKMTVVTRGGKEALTFYRVLENFSCGVSLVECKLATGRTHQIRVHMAHIGHPVVGDPVYGRRRLSGKGKKDGIIGKLEAFPRQALHAGELKFIHPRTKKTMRFKAKLPEDMKKLMKAMEKDDA
jgi:23S rRNA pseudouridine1911/1915/1917 synthase